MCRASALTSESLPTVTPGERRPRLGASLVGAESQRAGQRGGAPAGAFRLFLLAQVVVAGRELVMDGDLQHAQLELDGDVPRALELLARELQRALLPPDAAQHPQR